MIWKIWKKSWLNSEIIRKILKQTKSNSDSIWTTWKKDKVNSAMIWKIQKTM
jgi:hypothetical protein